MQTPPNLLFWILFLAFVTLMLVLDLGVFNRKARAFSLRQALGWTALWVALAAGFAVSAVFLRASHDRRSGARQSRQPSLLA